MNLGPGCVLLLLLAKPSLVVHLWNRFLADGRGCNAKVSRRLPKTPWILSLDGINQAIGNFWAANLARKVQMGLRVDLNPQLCLHACGGKMVDDRQDHEKNNVHAETPTDELAFDR